MMKNTRKEQPKPIEELLNPVSQVIPELSDREKKRAILRKVKRRRGVSRLYFNADHEAAIVRYTQSKNTIERSKIFSDWIYNAFLEIIENMVNTYSFGYLPNIADKKRECVAHAANQLQKFDPVRGKAFSFFSVIIKHWFLIEVARFQKTRKNDVSLDDIISNSLSASGEHVVAGDFIINSLDVRYERREFIEQFLVEYAGWQNDFRDKTNLMAVYHCVWELFQKDFIELNGFSRAAIYEYILEKTGLTPNQTANALYRLRKQYKEFHNNWYK